MLLSEVKGKSWMKNMIKIHCLKLSELIKQSIIRELVKVLEVSENETQYNKIDETQQTYLKHHPS